MTEFALICNKKVHIFGLCQMMREKFTFINFGTLAKTGHGSDPPMQEIKGNEICIVANFVLVRNILPLS